MGNRWTLQDAKNKFSAVVEAARAGQPQHVTRRGIEAQVVVSAEEYRRLADLELKPEKSFKDHLLEFPKLPEGKEDMFDKREPRILELNNIEFGD